MKHILQSAVFIACLTAMLQLAFAQTDIVSPLVHKALNAARLKGEDINGALLAPMKQSDYDTYATDSDMGPFITVAKTDHDTAIVFVIASNPRGHKSHAVYFKNDKPVFYATGGTAGQKASAEDIRTSLVALPDAIPVKPEPDPTIVPFLKPVNIAADDGTPLLAFLVSSTPKDKLFVPDPATGEMKRLK